MVHWYNGVMVKWYIDRPPPGISLGFAGNGLEQPGEWNRTIREWYGSVWELLRTRNTSKLWYSDGCSRGQSDWIIWKIQCAELTMHRACNGVDWGSYSESTRLHEKNEYNHAISKVNTHRDIPILRYLWLRSGECGGDWGNALCGNGMDIEL